MFGDDVPKPRVCRIGRCTLEDDSSASQQEWRVDNICMSCNPADITTAKKAIILMGVEYIFPGRGRA